MCVTFSMFIHCTVLLEFVVYREQVKKFTQSNLARGPCRGAVAYVHPIGPCGQWRAPNSPTKVPLPVNQSPNPTTCLIPGLVRPTMPNGIRIRSAIFPQCTGQTDRPTDRSFMGKFGAVDKTSSSFSAHGKIGNFVIIIIITTIGHCAPRVTRPNNDLCFVVSLLC